MQMASGPWLQQGPCSFLVRYLLSDNLLTTNAIHPVFQICKAMRAKVVMHILCQQGAGECPCVPSTPSSMSLSLVSVHGDNGTRDHKEQVRRTTLSWDSQLLDDNVFLFCTLVSSLRCSYVDAQGYKISLVLLSTGHRDKLKLISRKHLLNFCVIIIIKCTMNKINVSKISLPHCTIKLLFCVFASSLADGSHAARKKQYSFSLSLFEIKGSSWSLNISVPSFYFPAHLLFEILFIVFIYLF